MTTYIKNIDFSGQDIRGLSKNFVWKNIEMFSVITGRNASGKTKLLESIRDKYSSKFTTRYINTSYNPPLDSDMNLLSKEHNQLEGKPIWGERGRDDIYVQFDDMDKFILKNVVLARKKIMEQNEEYLAKNRLSGALIPDAEPEPCDEVNQMFEDANLQIRLYKSALFDRLQFVKDTASGRDIIEPTSLSSGEKLIFALGLWRFGSVDGKRTKLLLIDEFDAHLNPCLMKDFIDLLKKYFVEKGVQVIMTTHSPTTVVHSRDCGAKIIWMEEGEIIEDKSHQDVIRDLSSGLITVDDFMGDLKFLINVTHKNILYTEGKTDPKLLRSAVNIFEEKFKKRFNEIEFFGCVDDRRMIEFIKLPIGSKKVALLDNCKSKYKKEFLKSSFEEYNKNDENAVKVSVLNIPEEFNEIECLFEKEFLKNPYKFYPEIFNKDHKHFNEKDKKLDGVKNKFAEKIKKIVDEAIASGDNKKIKAAQEIFKNFEPLLAQILQSFDGVSLESKRLFLRPFKEVDFDLLFKLHSNPEVAKTTIDRIQTKEKVREHFDGFIAHQKKFGFSQWAVFEKESGEFVGRAGITRRALNQEIGEKDELRFALLPKFWGKGYASELTYALTEFAFENLKFKLLTASTSMTNEKSNRVLTKFGFKLIKTLVPQGYGTSEEIKYYEILPDEFRQNK